MRFADFRAKAGGTAQHLFEQNAAVNLPHKHKVADSRNINAGCQQINGNGNVWVLVVFKLFDYLQNLLFVATGGFACDFHNRLIGNAIRFINITKRIYNAVGVVIIDSKN